MPVVETKRPLVEHRIVRRYGTALARGDALLSWKLLMLISPIVPTYFPCIFRRSTGYSLRARGLVLAGDLEDRPYRRASSRWAAMIAPGSRRNTLDVARIDVERIIDLGKRHAPDRTITSWRTSSRRKNHFVAGPTSAAIAAYRAVVPR